MSPRERELESQLRQARSQVLDLRLRVHALEGENAEQRRRLRAQAHAMEVVKQSAYEAYSNTMLAMGQQYE